MVLEKTPLLAGKNPQYGREETPFMARNLQPHDTNFGNRGV